MDKEPYNNYGTSLSNDKERSEIIYDAINADDFITNPAHKAPKQNDVNFENINGVTVGGLYRLKQGFIKEFPELVDAAVPVSVKTQVDHKRVLVYASLFLIPLIISVIVLSTRGLFVFDVMEYRGQGAVLTYEYGFFSYCVQLKQASLDILSLDMLPHARKCVSYSKYCGRFKQSFSTIVDPFPLSSDRSAICSGKFATARVFYIIALIFGISGFICLVDNVFVWLNLSFWYQPSHHKSDSIRRIRRWFKVFIFTGNILHMLFVFGTDMLLRSIKHDEHYFPYTLEFGYGFWLSVFAWIFDVIIVIVFYILSRKTFFAVPIYKNGTEATGSVASQYMSSHPV